MGLLLLAGSSAHACVNLIKVSSHVNELVLAFGAENWVSRRASFIIFEVKNKVAGPAIFAVIILMFQLHSSHRSGAPNGSFR